MTAPGCWAACHRPLASASYSASPPSARAATWSPPSTARAKLAEAAGSRDSTDASSTENSTGPAGRSVASSTGSSNAKATASSQASDRSFVRVTSRQPTGQPLSSSRPGMTGDQPRTSTRTPHVTSGR